LALAAVVGVAVAGWLVADRGPQLLFTSPRCVAAVAGHSAYLDQEQAHHASTIAAIAVRRGLPARAVSIALATAYQESDIRNLDYGDRDSLGIFQQRRRKAGDTRAGTRPGLRGQAVLRRAGRGRRLPAAPITDAAQLVQRSAFGDAYADHEDDARAVASALTGYSRAAFSCVVREPAEFARAAARRAVRDVGTALADAFGDVGVDPGRSRLAVDAGSRTRGWALASYLVANADRLGHHFAALGRPALAGGDASEDGWRRDRRGRGDAVLVRVG
jgi:hypothetical protein